jgi:ubiquinone/menaquinone biosynthesis C-methylase UbiE
MNTKDTSWGGVAEWYDDHLEKDNDTYHAKVIFPNVLRLLNGIQNKKVLDLACGQGSFSEIMRNFGAEVTGVDISPELIKIAEERNGKEKSNIQYFTGSADDLYMIKNNSQDVVVCILALQNIENLQKTISEVSRVLKTGGKFTFVFNHPSFRTPKATSWEFDKSKDTQYRRVDEYMSESSIKIDMTPGSKKDKKYTVSFHRPLQVYVKALAKNNLLIDRLEEWISHRESEKGPRQKAENKSRKEIPLFMCISCIKN